jgi:hypothetical protein
MDTGMTKGSMIRMMREKRIYQAAAGSLILALALTAGGCSSKPSATAPTETPAVSASATGPANESVASSAAPAAIPTVLNQDKQAVAANAVQQAAAAETKQPAGSPAKTKKTFDSYTVDKPLLMGIAIGDSKDKTVQLHGSPADSYVMEDGDDPLTVAEYAGFNVGYNQKQQVEFVEIANGDVDPGLNGLRLGQSTNDALTALGKPDASTDYVLNYRSKTTVLKLDVDPKSKTVESIKLFRRTE